MAMPLVGTDVTVVTLDVDWAPDHAIDHAAGILREHGVRATWLVTHRSDAVERLRNDPGFEIGIHPNFASSSTHGADFATVLAHCLDLIPEATTMRTHHLFQMTPLFDVVLERTPIRADLSLYLHRAPGLTPVAFRSAGRTLHRFPTYWQDDQAMLEEAPCWEAETLLAPHGLKILNFHPMHVLLNSSTFEGYRALRDRGRIADLEHAHTAAFMWEGAGTATLFRDVVSSLAGGPTWLIRDLVAMVEGPQGDRARGAVGD